MSIKRYLLICMLTVPLSLQYQEAAAVLREKYRIAIFREDGFPNIGLPQGLTPEWIGGNLQKQDYQISYLNLRQIADKSFLNNEVDLLILPYGEAFPLEVFSSIKDYIEGGGGIFSIAGKPFWRPMKKNGNEWQEVDSSNPYEEFLSKLGIKYYQSEVKPVVCEFNQTLADGLPGQYAFTKSDIGVLLATSDKYDKIIPNYGNVFPYRIPCRDFVPIARSLDESGEVLAYPIILVKNWRNPYKQGDKIPNKWCLVTISGEKHPFNPQWPYAQEILSNLVEYLSNKVVLYSLESVFACYRQGEKVRFEIKALNYGRIKKDLRVKFDLKDSKDKIVYRVVKKISLLPNTEITIKDEWSPKEFIDDFYTIEATVRSSGKIVDKETNGFVIWDDRVLYKEKPFEIKARDFFIGGKKIFLSGTNYYESKLGELMWLHPNILSLKEDFQKMQKLGINFMRIHYHHSKWFRDYISQIAKLPLDVYFDAADKSPLPSERSLRIIDAFIQLAQKYGLIFCMDLFTLVPEEMGDPRGWLGLTERMLDPQKIMLQKEFIKILAKRYKDIPGITWDFWNEPRLEKQNDIAALREWAKQLVRAFRESGDRHPLTIGEDLSLQLLDVLDYASIHTYEPGNFSPPFELNKPFIFQEVWNEAGYNLEEEVKQAEKLKKDFSLAVSSGSAGFMPWQWTRQCRLWNNTNQPERWDDELGLCVHDDGTLKPAGRVYSLLINQVK